MVRYGRRTKRSYSRRQVRPVKYSNETYTIASSITMGGELPSTLNIPIIPTTDVQGVRKVKNFELSFNYSQLACPLIFAIVYVPQGTIPQELKMGTASGPVSLYEPNQNVVLTGILPINSNSITKFKTRLARNLNSGDSLFVCIRQVIQQDTTADFDFAMSLNYAICF